MVVSKCPCLTFSNVIFRCRNLVSKHQLRPSTLLAPATHILTDKATTIKNHIFRSNRLQLENKVHFTNLVICSLYWLLSCRAVNLQMNRTVKYQRALSRIVGFPLLPSPSPFNFFCSRSYFRPITRLETLATQANN